MCARLFGYAEEPLAPDVWIVDDPFESDDRSVGKCGDRGLEVQCFRQGHVDHVDTERLEVGGQLRDAFGVGAAADPDPHRPVVLQHVPAVEGARCLDRRDAITLSAHRIFSRDDLGPPFIGTRSADDREVAVDDHGVFDERRVRALRRGDHLVRGPASARERRNVALPLPLRQFGIHVIASVDVGDEPFCEPRGRPPDQGVASEHQFLLRKPNNRMP